MAKNKIIQTITQSEEALFLHRLLRGLRRAFDRFEFARTVLAFLAIALFIAFVAIGLDLLISLSPGWRWFAWGLLVLLAAAALAYLLGVTLLLPAGERWLAVHIERRHPQLKNRLITAVQILHGGPETAEFDPDFCLRLLRETCRFLIGLDSKTIVPWQSLRPFCAVVLIELAALTALYQAWPEGFRIAATRLLFPGRALEAATRTRVSVEPAGGITLARGDSLRFRARISGRPAPLVSLNVRRPGKPWTTLSMMPEQGLLSNAVPNGFTYEIRDVTDPLEYFVSAGDGRTPVYSVHILDRPRIRDIAVEYRFPAYLGLPPRRGEAGAGILEAPIGTVASLTVDTDSPVSGGHLKLTLQGETTPRQLPLRGVEPNRLTGEITLEKSGSYSPIVTNSAGLGEKQPPEYGILAQPDTPPIIEILEPARDLVIDDLQSIPVLAAARDDFGLASIYIFIATTNAIPAVSNGPAGPIVPGRKLVDLPEPGTLNQNAGLDIRCDLIADFTQVGHLSYTFYAVDRKGQVSASRPYTITLSGNGRDRALSEQSSSTLPEPPPLQNGETNKAALPPEVARLEALIQKQQILLDQVHRAAEEADKFRPKPAELAQDVRGAFDGEKRLAGELAETRNWAQDKLDQMAKAPTRQNPNFDRALRTTRDLMDSLRQDEVPNVLDALREAFLNVAPAGTNPPSTTAATSSPGTPAAPGSPAKPSTGTPVAPTAPPAGTPAHPPSSDESTRPQQPPEPVKSLSGADKRDVRETLARAIKEQEQILNKLDALKQRMESSLPGAVDEAALNALDQKARDDFAAEAEQFKDGLQFASDKIEAAAEKFKPLAERQKDIRAKTLETESERIRNLAKSEDRLKLDTGHTEDYLKENLPWFKPTPPPPAAIPQAMAEAQAPQIAPAPVPPAPRKTGIPGEQPPGSSVEEPNEPNPTPKMLMPDRYPSTFRGDFKDQPIPPPPPIAAKGKMPTASLKKMSDAEKEALHKESMLDSLEINDDGKAMGIGAGGHEEIPEEMVLEPGAQYTSGPSIGETSRPGMELGQMTGENLGSPQQPPMGGGGGGGGEKNGPPPPPSSSPGQPTPPNAPPSSGSSSGGSSGGQSNPSGKPGKPGQPGQPQPQPGQPSQPGQPAQPGSQQNPSDQPGQANQPGQPGQQGPTPDSPAASAMQQAATALGSSDRTAALANQDAALAAIDDRLAQLNRIGGQVADLSRQFDAVHRIVGSPDIRQAEALNTLEQALKNPAWQILNEPLSDPTRLQLQTLRDRLQQAYSALGGTARFPVAEVTLGNQTNLLDWATFNLPPHLRQELLDGLRETGPAAYRQILEDYYRSISSEK
jgi:hypothetical protein